MKYILITLLIVFASCSKRCYDCSGTLVGGGQVCREDFATEEDWQNFLRDIAPYCE